ncbi:helix-turn-helix domain-containing protein [Streptomyces nodosus]|uniref:helix-turn-helix domain-containing protein n=1 Tax=Streptomyces nodosus TaxID=40318 RepID=UPI003451C410
MEQQHEFLTTTEVAAFFRVGRKTVSQWCRSGHLKAIRVSEKGDWRVRRTSVEALAAGTAEGQ